MNPSLHKEIIGNRTARRENLVLCLVAARRDLLLHIGAGAEDMINNDAGYSILLTAISINELTSKIQNIDGDLHVLELAAPAIETD